MREPLLYSGCCSSGYDTWPSSSLDQTFDPEPKQKCRGPPALPDLFHSTIFDTISEGTTVRDMTLAISIDMDTYLPRSIIIYCNTPTYGKNCGSS